MLKTLSIGVGASILLSSTFLINRLMGTGGGNWMWMGSLRVLVVFILLTVYWFVTGVGANVLTLLSRHRLLWLTAGTLGFGVSYAVVCFLAHLLPAWVVATGWQMNVLISPLVLRLFGRSVPRKGVALSAMIFLGIMLVEMGRAATDHPLSFLLERILPFAVIAITYMVGNQLLKECLQGRSVGPFHPVNEPLASSGFVQIYLMTTGAIPFWIILLIVSACAGGPLYPTPTEILGATGIAVCSGILGMGFYYHARHRARADAYQIAGVDATIAVQVVATLAIELVFLSGSWPNMSGWIGLTLVAVGLVLYPFLR